jgi:hypothetical protein
MECRRWRKASRMEGEERRQGADAIDKMAKDGTTLHYGSVEK